ncbi:hypothetical protein V6N11_068504 [Hibiscus sabdariffa]|uniref:Cold regulated protein 27 n=1 Tax=Hibiscus sabdariffa TaxID=183260 RepID=A0ABR2P9V7_9ROSI
MGHNLRLNFPAPASDPLACLNELTQTNSDSSASGVTIECFRDPTASSTPQCETMVWTNEKHSSYLEFLEASFVKKLHYSMGLRGCHPREEMWEPCPRQLPAGVHNSSHQFSALQDGCYQKTNDPLLDSTADSSDIRESPLHHFMSAGKSSETFPLSRETVIADGGTYRKSNTTIGGCTTEVSDQNFVDEDQREKTSHISGAKRLKMTTMHDASTKELHPPKVDTQYFLKKS